MLKLWSSRSSVIILAWMTLCEPGKGSELQPKSIIQTSANRPLQERRGEVFFTLSGTIRGLSGEVTLKSGATDSLVLRSDGAFSFSKPVRASESFSVSVEKQPLGQTCVVYNSSSVNVAQNVTNLAVNCSEFYSLPQNFKSSKSLASTLILDAFMFGKWIYVATASGLSISADGGETWITRTTANGLGDNYVNKVFASDSGIYAGTRGGLSVSTDGGLTWKNTTIDWQARENIPSQTPSVEKFSAIGKNVFAVLPGKGSSSVELWMSRDNGLTWHQKTETHGLQTGFTSGRVFTSEDKVFVTSDRGLSISTDNGSTWKHKELSLKYETGIHTIVDIAGSGSEFYAAADDALYITKDAFRSWSRIEVGGAGQYIGINEVIFGGKTIYVDASKGFYKSIDKGITWTKADLKQVGENKLFPLFVKDQTIIAEGSHIKGHGYPNGGLFISTDGGSTWINRNVANHLSEAQARDVLVSGANVYVATNEGVAISKDGGETWTNKTTQHGLKSNSTRGIAALDSTILVTTNAGLALSKDAGLTWINKTTANGLGSNHVNSVFVSDNTIFAATGYIPSHEDDDEESSPGGVSISKDGGRTWVNRVLGNIKYSYKAISIAVLSGTIFAGTNRGMFVSKNKGITWSHITAANGFSDHLVYGISGVGKFVYAATYDGLFISSDGGLTWVQKNDIIQSRGTALNGVSVFGNTVYLAASEGLFISMDLGKTWARKTTANGLGSNWINRVFAVGSTLYVATDKFISVKGSVVAIQ